MYRIVITKTVEVTKKSGRDWAVLSKDAEGREVKGYTPEKETTVTETLEIYAQVVDELNLFAVIEAVNAGREEKDT